jgi:hypothetical protein
MAFLDRGRICDSQFRIVRWPVAGRIICDSASASCVAFQEGWSSQTAKTSSSHSCRHFACGLPRRFWDNAANNACLRNAASICWFGVGPPLNRGNPQSKNSTHFLFRFHRFVPGKRARHNNTRSNKIEQGCWAVILRNQRLYFLWKEHERRALSD